MDLVQREHQRLPDVLSHIEAAVHAHVLDFACRCCQLDGPVDQRIQLQGNAFDCHRKSQTCSEMAGEIERTREMGAQKRGHHNHDHYFRQHLRILESFTNFSVVRRSDQFRVGIRVRTSRT